MVTLQIDPEKVAAYIRWSTDEQSDGTTLAVQQEACQHFILSQGWRVREDLVFVDEGYSGGSMDRPALMALRKAIKAGRIDCCVVYKLDRLSRSVLDTVNLVLQEWEGLCYVKSTREPIDTTTPSGKMFFYMLASYAEWERSVIRERTFSGKVKRAQQGKNPGFTYPYGYRQGHAPGEWAIAETEATVVRRVFHEYIHGHGYGSISDGLNRDGLRSRHGGPFHPTLMMKIIKNPCYTGVLNYGRSTELPPQARLREGKARLNFAEPRYAKVEGALPVIIGPEEFAAAQAVREAREGVKSRRSLSASFLLSGIARCRCGAPLKGSTDHRKGMYYRCTRNIPGVADRCRCAMMSAPRLEQLVISYVRAAFAPYQRQHYLASAASQMQQRIVAAQEAIATVEEALAGIKRRRRRLDADYDAGDLSAKLYNSRVEELEAEQANLLSTQGDRLHDLERLQGHMVDANQFDDMATRLGSWDDMDRETQKQILRLAIASCVLYRAPGDGQAHSRAPVEIDLEIRHWRPEGPQSVQSPALSLLMAR